MRLAWTLCLGVVLGSAVTVTAANLWPRTRLAPTFYARDSLRFGITTDGRVALCDSDNVAFSLGDSGVGYMTVRDGLLLKTVSCEGKGR